VRPRAATSPDHPGRERAFTVKALVLNVLLFRDGIGIRDLREEIEAINGGIEVRHSAVFAAGKSLEADGLVVGVKEPRSFGGGPPTLLFRITERGREVADDMRQQAERLLYWPKLKCELGRRSTSE
jgi:DNA-binding PadR family transcriptional regulator